MVAKTRYIFTIDDDCFVAKDPKGNGEAPPTQCPNQPACQEVLSSWHVQAPVHVIT